MKILIVKLSSLGDVVHTMPAVMDVHQIFPYAQIDWVVERAFVPLVSMSQAVHRIIPIDLRRWRKTMLSAQTRQEWREFMQTLHQTSYDAVIDLQGLSKSALVARLAIKAPHGRRYAMGNRTDGSGYEALTRWVADVAVPMPTQIHALDRSRLMCARALGYDVPSTLNYGLKISVQSTREQVVLVHGTSREDKQWPDDHWIILAKRLAAQGLQVVLPYGTDKEFKKSQALAAQMSNAQVWPKMGLDALTQEMSRCVGVIGVDSGLSHIAVALGLPHVQIYNFDTAWRTGPQGLSKQMSVYAQPTPDVDQVWQAWLEVRS